MMTLDEIMDNCRIEDADSGSPHWIWRGGMTGKTPRIWAPDYTRTQQAIKAGSIRRADGPLMASQPGRRAAYHLSTGKVLPSGWRVFATCEEYGCVIHFGAGPAQETGRQISKMGWHKDSIRHKLASRATGRKRSKLTMGMIHEIQQSNEPGVVLAKRMGIGQTLVSKVRIHGLPSHQPIGGFFSGLGARAAA